MGNIKGMLMKYVLAGHLRFGTLLGIHHDLFSFSYIKILKY